MRSLLHFVSIVLLASTCGATGVDLANYKAMEPCADHYPHGTFPQEYDGMEDTVRHWYATPLNALRAPCLRDFSPPGAKVFRFTWMPSFDPSVVVTVLTDGDACVAHGASIEWRIETFLPWAVKNVAVTKTVEVTISENTCRELVSTIDQSGFWRMATVDPDDGGYDGAQWILEGSDAGSGVSPGSKKHGTLLGSIREVLSEEPHNPVLQLTDPV